MSDITLSPAELVRVTGGYRRASDQLAELHRMGFSRARRSRCTGEVVVERAHYDAVVAAASRSAPEDEGRPKVTPPVLKVINGKTRITAPGLR